jgi:hypothetical protein
MERIKRILILVEQIILAFSVICFASFILNSIFDGIQDYIVAKNTTSSISTKLTNFVLLIIIFLNSISRVVYQLSHSIMSRLHDVTFVAVVRHLYFNGPFLKGYGFWQGKPIEDICGIMDPKPNFNHWSKNGNIDDCRQMVETDIQGYVLILQLIMLSFLSLKYINLLWSRLMDNKKRVD